jgi:putative addiction module killer protein
MVDDMLPKGYSLHMIEVRRTEAFTSWLDALRDERAKARIASRIRMMAFGTFGDHKAAGGHGVQELRVDYGPGYRVYYVQHGKLLVILLCGGYKDTQRKDINAARKLAASL